MRKGEQASRGNLAVVLAIVAGGVGCLLLAGVVLIGTFFGVRSFGLPSWGGRLLESLPAIGRLGGSSSGRSGGGSRQLFAPACWSVDLEDEASTYVIGDACEVGGGWYRTVDSNEYSVRCSVALGVWRNYAIYEIDVAGADILTATAGLELYDHIDFFSECGAAGVKYDDYVEIFILPEDPRPLLRSDCPIQVSKEKDIQKKCLLSEDRALAQCGVERCRTSQSCRIEADVSRQDTVYLVFRVSDAWLADIEGTLSDLEVCVQ